jgi:peptidoglycan/LPS O-acetylase OafA/YrhL
MRYLVTNAVVPTNWSFGEALQRASHPEAWNAPLWTLTHEMCCYVIAGVSLGSAFVRKNAAVVSGSALAFLTAASLWLERDGSLAGTNALDFLHLLSFFVAGAFLWALRDRVKVRGPIVAIAIAGASLVGLIHATDQLAPLPVAYLVLAAGAALPIRLGNQRDLSYGLYIFAWPVQTLLYLAGVPQLGWGVYAFLSFAFALPAAWASWALVEGPALGLRRRLAAMATTGR